MKNRVNLTPENMKESLWEIANEVRTSALDTNIAKTFCTTCRTILQVVKEERHTKAYNSAVKKIKNRVEF
jgi:hypothetical protein